MRSWKALETLIGGIVSAINHAFPLKSKRSMNEKYFGFIYGLDSCWNLHELRPKEQQLQERNNSAIRKFILNPSERNQVK